MKQELWLKSLDSAVCSPWFSEWLHSIDTQLLYQLKTWYPKLISILLLLCYYEQSSCDPGWYQLFRGSTKIKRSSARTVFFCCLKLTHLIWDSDKQPYAISEVWSWRGGSQGQCWLVSLGISRCTCLTRPPLSLHSLFLSLLHTSHTHTQREVWLNLYILLLLNKFLMSCCGLTGKLHSIPHTHTLFRCGLAKCAFNSEFSNWTKVSHSRLRLVQLVWGAAKAERHFV